MIEINNLSKVFKDRKLKTKVEALKDIDIVLPDTGLVFIIGKSGSGKTTLLNMIGGLDSPTTGSIIADGNELTKFNSHDYNKYRSSYVGFIFQDYHLLNELTIEQNIKFFLEKNKQDIDITALLNSVGLEGLKDRYPSQLSGGQRQRVAIARAIAKDAKIILCDEPTGNLDKETSIQIIEILKQLSKTKLVLIVSHNIDECEMYADRIIELVDGKIHLDRYKRKDYINDLYIKDGKLIIPHDKVITKEELEFVNDAIKNKEVKEIVQNDNGYSKIVKTKLKQTKIHLNNGHISKRNIFRLFLSFIKTSPIHSIITILIASLIVGVSSIFQSFLNFNPIKDIVDSINSSDTPLVLMKDYEGELLDVRKILHPVKEEDINAFKNTGYKDKIYNVYKSNINISGGTCYRSVLNATTLSVNPIFLYELEGVVECDEQYLKALYKDENQIEYVALTEEIDPNGIYVTDLFADSVIASNPGLYPTYEKVLGFGSRKNKTCYINGILDTGYKLRYASLFEEIKNIVADTNLKAKDKVALLQDNKNFRKYVSEVNSSLSFGYYINGSYLDSFYSDTKIDTLIGENILYFEKENKPFTPLTSYSYLTYNDNVKDDEILISYTLYNYLTGSNITASEVNDIILPPLDITVYKDNNIYEEVLFKKSFNVKLDKKTNKMTFSKNTFDEYIAVTNYAYALMFETKDHLNEIIKTMDLITYLPMQAETQALHGVSRAVIVLGKTFELILVMLITLLILFIIGFSFSSIMNNKYQIGVIKALGGSTTDIGKIFVLKVVVISILTCVISTILCAILLPFANSVISKAFTFLYSASTFGLSIVSFDIVNILIFIGILLLTFILGALIPLLFLKRIKPAEIIKARE